MKYCYNDSYNHFKLARSPQTIEPAVKGYFHAFFYWINDYIAIFIAIHSKDT